MFGLEQRQIEGIIFVISAIAAVLLYAWSYNKLARRERNKKEVESLGEKKKSEI